VTIKKHHVTAKELTAQDASQHPDEELVNLEGQGQCIGQRGHRLAARKAFDRFSTFDDISPW
jgi:hypothetical protein